MEENEGGFSRRQPDGTGFKGRRRWQRHSGNMSRWTELRVQWGMGRAGAVEPRARMARQTGNGGRDQKEGTG